jgi:hypothetical protein
MKNSDPPPISKEKARRLRVGHSHRRAYFASFLAVAALASMGGAYGLLHGDSSCSSTHTFTTSSTGLQATSLTLVCNPAPQVVGANSTCAATVGNSQGDGQVSAPSGNVSFSSNSAGNFGAATCAPSSNNLVCTTTYSPRSGSEGSHSLTATFAGDSNHAGSSGDFTLQVSRRPTTIASSCSPQLVPVNSKTSCTAHVSDTGGGSISTPSGSVKFSQTQSGTFNPSACSLSGGSCSVSFMPSSGKEGQDSVALAYGGDQDHLPSTSSVSNALSAVARSTTATVSCASSQAEAGIQISCTAKVVDTTSVGNPLMPMGNFTFTSSSSVSSFDPRTCVLQGASNGSASCGTQYTPASGSLGIQKLWGKYSGNVDHSGSSASPISLQIKPRASATVLWCPSKSVVVGNRLNCVVSVSDLSTGTLLIPAGKVSFASNTTATFVPSTCYIHSGSCTFGYIPGSGSEGISMITALYSGDGNHTSSSGTLLVAVLPMLSSTSVSCTPTSISVGSVTSCTASVSAASGSTTSALPSGTVTFSAANGDFTPGASCQLSAGSCTVSFTPSRGSEGSISIGAGYSGDENHLASAASPITVTATTRSVTVSVVCSPASTLPFSNTTCTATVIDSDSGNAIDPSGTVSFNASVTGVFSPTSCTLSSGSCSVTFTPPGVSTSTTIQITATYSGDTDHSGGSDSTTIQAT